MTFAYALSVFPEFARFRPSYEFCCLAASVGLAVWDNASRSDVATWALRLAWQEKSTIIVAGRSIQVFTPGQGYWRAFFALEG